MVYYSSNSFLFVALKASSGNYFKVKKALIETTRKLLFLRKEKRRKFLFLRKETKIRMYSFLKMLLREMSVVMMK